MRLRPALALILFASIAACDSAEEPIAESKPADATPAKRPSDIEPPPSTPTQVESNVDAPTLVVHEPGQQPRAALRLQPEPGSKEMMEMRMDMAMAMDLGGMGNAPRVVLPTLVTEAEIKLSAKTGKNLAYDATFGAPRVEDNSELPPEAIEQMKTQLASLGGMRGRFELDDRGQLQSGTMDIPDDAPPNTRQLMEQMTQNLRQISIPLPEEPVGPGARWTANSELELGGLKLQQATTYELLGCEDKVCKMDVEVVQATTSEEFSPPGMPSVKAKVKEYRSSATGTVQIDLRHVTPDESRMTLRSHFAFEMDAMGQTSTMAMDMDMKMAIVRQQLG